MVGKVLIIDGQATGPFGMGARLAAASYEPVPASDGSAALLLARRALPDAVLLDLDLTGSPDSLGLIRLMRADRRLGSVPMIGLGRPEDAERRIAALDAGADDVLSKPVSDGALLARLRNLMRRPEPMGDLAPVPGYGMAEAAAAFERPGLIAIVAARPEAALRLRSDLTPLLPHRCVTLTPNAALTDAGANVPDVFLIEGELDGPEGTLSLMADLRSRSAARHAAFCLLRPAESAGMDAVAFDLGAQDVSGAGGNLRELALRLSAVMRRKQAVDAHRARVQEQLRLAVRDPLTGLHNRRFALNQLAGMAEAARVEDEQYAVILLDLDRFKQVNDLHGHSGGDAVLMEVGERLAANIRAGDLLARFGGEEFLIALPRADADVAMAAAERLCAAVQEADFALPDGARVALTASLGMALGGAGMAVGDVIEQADRALYAAKAGGRNRVETAAA